MANATTRENRFTLFIFLFFRLWSCCDGYSEQHSEPDLLLSFKLSVFDPLRFLSNWNSSDTPFCHWNGISCNSNSSVSGIHISGKNLSGTLTTAASSALFRGLSHVEAIDLSNNQLSGTIPPNIFSSSSLRYLNLSNNNFTGRFAFGASSKLDTLDLSNNMLTGEIPGEIGSFFSGLRVLDLGGNALVGEVPKSMANITSLEVLTLASNKLLGQIPRDLSKLKRLKWIYLGYNNFSGEIPEELGELTSLNHLNLVSNNLTGEIPSSLGNLTNLTYLFLYFNGLTGPIPGSIFNLKRLISLDLSDNFLSGGIPERVSGLHALEILHLFSNNLSGKIPSSIVSLPHLQVLQLWSNRLSGEIPEDLGKRNNLTILDLSTNNLTGRIPGSLCDSGQLKKIILFSNSLTGPIPKSLSRCVSLQRVRLQNNKLSGRLPPEFTKLPLVYFLDLSGNKLWGDIQGQKWEMPELQMLNLAKNRFSGGLPDSLGSKKLENLDMSENGFSGSIPTSFNNFPELMQLKLSKNRLSGKIPEELSACRKLVSLDLSYNELTGEIPESLSRLPVLGNLDMSMNHLSGKIPGNLGKVESLVQVNISHNHLRGKLPSTGAFLAINSSAVAGNNLCGGGAATGLPPCKGIKNPNRLWFVAAFLLAIALCGIFIVVLKKRHNGAGTIEAMRVESSEDGTWKLQVFDDKARSFLIMDDILNCVRDENIFWRGRRGVSYKGKVAKKNGMHIFVKEYLNGMDQFIPAGSWPGYEEIGKLRHKNIVNLLAVCRSEKSMIFVYEYIEGKSLSELVVLGGLHWESRRKIAIGIARALRYLHGFGSSNSPVVGINLSSEKVIIDRKCEARLKLSLSGGGSVFAGSKCLVSSAYVTPGEKETKETNQSRDIYGFGIILIELVTGKTQADVEFNGMHRNVVEWARYCYTDCHLDSWIDPIIKVDNPSNRYPSMIFELMNLALRCTSDDTLARPSAIDVAETLETITRGPSCALC